MWNIALVKGRQINGQRAKKAALGVDYEDDCEVIPHIELKGIGVLWVLANKMNIQLEM
jgi:hypothetical protein